MRKPAVLDALFPKVRQEVLAAILLEPSKWWYLSDLAKHIGRQPSSLQRELDSLVNAGIFRHKKEQGRVYFQAEQNCPLFPELRAILLRTVGLVDVLRESLAPLSSRIVCAFVYGSVAQGREVSQSDVDLMLIAKLKLADAVESLRNAENRLGRQVNTSVYSPTEFSKKLKEKNHFLHSVLEGRKLFVIGDESVLSGYAQ
jgi:predicted nucleotidyltransferase